MKTIRIYSDESRHKNERFLLLGGLWVEEQNIPIVEDGIRQLRKKNGYKDSQGRSVDFSGEFKWTKVSDKYISVYKELVDLFFDWIKKDVFRFCTMLIDTKNPIVVNYSNIKREGYFKLLFQLYFQNSRVPAIYKIYPDKITNPIQHNVDFAKLNECLDKAFSKKFLPLLNPNDRPGIKGFVNNITPVDSKQTQCIQIIDVIIGAIGYLQNGLFKKPGAKKAKVELMKYIFEKITLYGAMKIRGKNYYVIKSTKFNVWIFRPKNKKSHL